MDFIKIKNLLIKQLSPKRYEHTLGVVETCEKLALCFGVDTYRAKLAGLLHDCAKCLEEQALLQLAKENDIPIRPVEERQPYLLHGKVGALLAQRDYGVNDPEILQAIAVHTTGRHGMSMLEKILFVADYIEPGRNKVPDLDTIRELAFVDIDAAIVVILENTLRYLKETNKEIDPITEELYNEFM